MRHTKKSKRFNQHTKKSLKRSKSASKRINRYTTSRGGIRL